MITEDLIGRLLDVIDALDTYVEFLGEECGRLSSFGLTHPWMIPSDEVIEQGRELRSRIAQAKATAGIPTEVTE